MKSLWVSLIILVGITSAFSVHALPWDGKADEAALEGADAVEAIAIANQWKWTQKGMKNTVNSREVVFQFPDGRVKKISLPEEKMVVAIAPYIKGTHPCETHNFSSCKAELIEQTFWVKGVDREGNILVNQAVTTLQNGFFELWLPRDRRVMLNIRKGDLTAEGEIETFPDSKTCVTTFQLL
jgi:hypothetical protein